MTDIPNTEVAREADDVPAERPIRVIMFGGQFVSTDDNETLGLSAYGPEMGDAEVCCCLSWYAGFHRVRCRGLLGRLQGLQQSRQSDPRVHRAAAPRTQKFGTLRTSRQRLYFQEGLRQGSRRPQRGHSNR